MSSFHIAPEPTHQPYFVITEVHKTCATVYPKQILPSLHLNLTQTKHLTHTHTSTHILQNTPSGPPQKQTPLIFNQEFS